MKRGRRVSELLIDLPGENRWTAQFTGDLDKGGFCGVLGVKPDDSGHEKG